MDINRSFITKLAWNVCTTPGKIWIHLIKVRYLRGRQFLDIEKTVQTASWIVELAAASLSLNRGSAIRLLRILTLESLVTPSCTNY